MKSFSLFGRGSRGEDEPPKPPSGERRAGPRPEDSFLTGDERADATSVNLLLATIAEVNSTIDLDQLLGSVVDKAIAVTRAERGFLLLREGSGDLVVKVARDAAGNSLPKETRFSTKITQQVESSAQPVRSMVNSDAKALELSQSVFDLKIRAVMCVPLRARHETPLGVVYVDSRVQSREFTPADLKYFAAFATQATIALEKAKWLRDSIEKERMSQELRIAQQIQSRMLPRDAPQVEGFDFHGIYEAATETAGDSYDFKVLPGGKVAFVVTDVSGHGIGPALVTMATRARLRTYLGLGLGLGESVTRLNRSFRDETEEGMFQTLFVGILDPKNGDLEYVNAGHPPPLLRRRGAGEWEHLTRSGIALGLSDDETYEPLRVKPIAKGDFLLAYTDGLTEARPVFGEGIFGEERLCQLLLAREWNGAREIVDAVVEGVRQFSGGALNDDLTLLALRARS